MEWKGFIAESKLFCDYEEMNFLEKIKWWFQCFFIAGPRFYFYGPFWYWICYWKDKIQTILNKNVFKSMKKDKYDV